MPRYGRAGRVRLPRLREWPFRIERCCSSQAPLPSSETRQLWPGTAPRRESFKNRTSYGPTTRLGAWPARSTRRSSSLWDALSKRPKLWLEPCPEQSDTRSMENRLRCTATSASIRSSASSCRRGHFAGVRSREPDAALPCAVITERYVASSAGAPCVQSRPTTAPQSDRRNQHRNGHVPGAKVTAHQEGLVSVYLNGCEGHPPKPADLVPGRFAVHRDEDE
jgi:hypothetical protein